jgi:hypothetical protein
MNITDQARQQLTEPNTASLHQIAASQRHVYELGSLVMARWPVTVAGEERRGEEEDGNMLTIRPGACLDGMAGQCPRGRPETTRGSLHRSTTGSTALGASTGDAHTP